MLRFALFLCVLSAGAGLLGLPDVAKGAAIAAAAFFTLATAGFAVVVLVVSLGRAVTGPSRYWLPDP
jgi:hypothetical protein